jgi:hypothetical protein
VPRGTHRSVDLRWQNAKLLTFAAVEILRLAQDEGHRAVWVKERLGIGHGGRGDALRRRGECGRLGRAAAEWPDKPW